MKALTGFSAAAVTAIFAAGTFGVGAAVAQTGSQPTSAQSSSPAAGAAATQTSDGAYATGKPLEMQSKEGFWGHMNPFARKKWVHRQVDPIADRANELDELQAKNANDIKDVDARATAGVNRAMNAANTADAHAADAASRASVADATAKAADAHTAALNGTVSSLDQYEKVSATSLPFLAGHTMLTSRQKANLDEVANALASQKGYIVEVQGYSRSGVAASQAMADSVVRYLVTAHQVPLYRIYRTGLGKADPQTASTDETGKPLTNGVRVTVLHNSLASMPAGGASSPTSN
jgi:outer membrane protein OmpA-like peptidoglycan-associated protein